MLTLWCKTRKHCRSSEAITLLIVIADKHTMDMDKILEGLDSMETGMCHICLQDIPVDEDSPNRLLKHVCVWNLFVRAPVYLGMWNDWACCRMCGRCIRIPNGNIADVINHMITSWCRDKARHRWGLPKTWHGGWTGWWDFLY